MTGLALHGMTPCDAHPYAEPPLACFSPGPEPTCSECGCGFAPREWHHPFAGVVGLRSEAS